MGISPATGPLGRVDTGYHLLPGFGLFARGQWDRTGPSAWGGARWDF